MGQGRETKMPYKSWEDMLYTQKEFANLYAVTKGFNDDIHHNHRVRDDGESFSAFVDSGSDALIQDSPDFVDSLI